MYSRTVRARVDSHLQSIAENQRNTVNLYLQELVSPGLTPEDMQVFMKGLARFNRDRGFDRDSEIPVGEILQRDGLLARGIGEFHEAGIIPTIVEHVWDLNNIIPEESTIGQFLTAIFGYIAAPSLVEMAGYIVYLALTLIGYFRPAKAKVEAKATV